MYPYCFQGQLVDCWTDRDFIAAEISEYVDIESGDENALMLAVGTVGPISVGVDASQPSFQNYESGGFTEADSSM